MKKKSSQTTNKLYTSPEEKASERAMLWAKRFAQKMEVKYERVPNKEYQNWLLK